MTCSVSFVVAMRLSSRRNSIKDPAIKKLVQGVNGPLLEALAKRAKYHDKDCVDLFKTGAPIVGVLERHVSAVCLRYLCPNVLCCRGRVMAHHATRMLRSAWKS